jgi:hypothetical protein
MEPVTEYTLTDLLDLERMLVEVYERQSDPAHPQRGFQTCRSFKKVLIQSN